jgi:hypothetical protein
MMDVEPWSFANSRLRVLKKTLLGQKTFEARSVLIESINPASGVFSETEATCARYVVSLLAESLIGVADHEVRVRTQQFQLSRKEGQEA